MKLLQSSERLFHMSSENCAKGKRLLQELYIMQALAHGDLLLKNAQQEVQKKFRVAVRKPKELTKQELQMVCLIESKSSCGASGGCWEATDHNLREPFMKPGVTMETALHWGPPSSERIVLHHSSHCVCMCECVLYVQEMRGACSENQKTVVMA